MLDNQQIVSYLKDDKRRPLLNFNSIERQYGLGKGRIYTVLSAKDAGNEFRADEIPKLSSAIFDLQFNKELL